MSPKQSHVDAYRIFAKNKLERSLFHGTRETTVRNILTGGFNRDYNKRHVYGKVREFIFLFSFRLLCEPIDVYREYILLGMLLLQTVIHRKMLKMKE